MPTRRAGADPDDFQVPFGQVGRWRFITNGNAPHPVHIHGASFQVVSRGAALIVATSKAVLITLNRWIA